MHIRPSILDIKYHLKKITHLGIDFFSAHCESSHFCALLLLIQLPMFDCPNQLPHAPSQCLEVHPCHGAPSNNLHSPPPASSRSFFISISHYPFPSFPRPMHLILLNPLIQPPLKRKRNHHLPPRLILPSLPQLLDLSTLTGIRVQQHFYRWSVSERDCCWF